MLLHFFQALTAFGTMALLLAVQYYNRPDEDE